MILIATQVVAIIFLCLFLPALLPVAGVFAIIWLVSIIAAIIVSVKGRSPEINCSVILLIIALPVAGAFVYAFSCIGKKKRGIMRAQLQDEPSGDEALVYAMCGTGGAGYDRCVYLPDGEKYFNLLFRQIAAAKSSVYLEYFIVARGEIFNRLIQALSRAKRNGVRILIVIDGIGCAFKLGRRDRKRLKAAATEVKVFNRLKPFFSTRLNNRDHRKIAVIDGKTAFTGGFNLADEYANIGSPYGYWKDTGVAIYGPAASMFEAMFLSVWNCGYNFDFADGGKKRCIPYYDSPATRIGVCEDLYMAAICAAKRRVHIFTPYFCPGEKLTSALKVAAMRDVDVKIILPHIPDKKYAFELSKTYAGELCRCGIEFYEFTPGFMHAKSLICDDKLYIGSYNFDYRSMRLNYECGVLLDGRPCEEAEEDFLSCLALSAPFVAQNPSSLRAVYRFLLKLFAPLF